MTLFPVLELPAPELFHTITTADFTPLDELAELHQEAEDTFSVLLTPDFKAHARIALLGFEEPADYDQVREAIRPFLGTTETDIFAIERPIAITYNNGPVKPDRAQRKRLWHPDIHLADDGFGIMVTDVLPTEFAIGSLRGKHRKAVLATNPFLFAAEGIDERIDRAVQTQVNAGRLRVEQAPKMRVAKFNKRHFHRSQENQTDETIDRHFVRAYTIE